MSLRSVKQVAASECCWDWGWSLATLPPSKLDMGVLGITSHGAMGWCLSRVCHFWRMGGSRRRAGRWSRGHDWPSHPHHASHHELWRKHGASWHHHPSSECIKASTVLHSKWICNFVVVPSWDTHYLELDSKQQALAGCIDHTCIQAAAARLNRRFHNTKRNWQSNATCSVLEGPINLIFKGPFWILIKKQEVWPMSSVQGPYSRTNSRWSYHGHPGSIPCKFVVPVGKFTLIPVVALACLHKPGAKATFNPSCSITCQQLTSWLLSYSLSMLKNQVNWTHQVYRAHIWKPKAWQEFCNTDRADCHSINP